MRLVWSVIFVVFVIIELTQYHVEAQEGRGDFLDHWVVEIEGGVEVAKEVIDHHGFVLDRQFHSIPDHYVIKRADGVPHRSKRSATHHTNKLIRDDRIKFAEQQQEVFRAKRGHLYNRALADEIAQSTAELNDPAYIKQWYMAADPTKHDLGILKAWQLGVSGKNVCVTILDDGLEKGHPDLAPNYKPRCSYDFNDNDPDPSPRYEETNENKHGTRCGGEIAMVANNNVCGVGIAFDSGIGGVRMLDGKVTDHVEGDSIGFGVNVDITSASWGPNDDGKTVEGPRNVAWKGMMKSIKEGREGKGTLLVWAAGNGAHLGDNCNCDGYTSSIYTLSVSSASQSGHSPWYSEKCSSTLAATYSSGSRGEQKVVSADLHGKCTDQHTGTSAAAPMAAGILALVLEANPNLTWRDAQHLVVFTSNPEPLKNEGGWYRNGAGLCVNHAFGFGLMQAGDMVEEANPKNFEHVGEQKICRVKPDAGQFPKYLSSGNEIEVEINTDGCKDQDEEINYLEHVQIIFDMDYSRRGRIYAELESPAGTITPLMFERGHDSSKDGFKHWPLSSVHNWGEHPSGTWIFRVADNKEDQSHSGHLKGIELVAYGTKEKPYYHDRLKLKECPSEAHAPTIPPVKIEEDPLEKLKNLFKDI